MSGPSPEALGLLLVGLFFLLAGVLTVIRIFQTLKGATPSPHCTLQVSRLDRRIDENKAYFSARCNGLHESINKHMDKIEKQIDAMDRDWKEQLREMRRESLEGDKGLQQLSKDLVNAVTEMKEIAKGARNG